MTGRSASATDRRWLALAIEISRQCPPAAGAYSVGAVIVGPDDVEISRGYSRETDPHIHAEESALTKINLADSLLSQATLYSSLEPCTTRRSRPRPCTDLILAAGILRVVIAWREPSLFVADCRGVETLTNAGVVVVEIDDLRAAATAVNAHLPGIST